MREFTEKFMLTIVNIILVGIILVALIGFIQSELTIYLRADDWVCSKSVMIEKNMSIVVSKFRVPDSEQKIECIQWSKK